MTTTVPTGPGSTLWPYAQADLRQLGLNPEQERAEVTQVGMDGQGNKTDALYLVRGVNTHLSVPVSWRDEGKPALPEGYWRTRSKAHGLNCPEKLAALMVFPQDVQTAQLTWADTTSTPPKQAAMTVWRQKPGTLPTPAKSVLCVESSRR